MEIDDIRNKWRQLDEHVKVQDEKIRELTDAVVVVVSEETGALSVVKSGQIKHNIDPQKFGSVLKKALGQK